MGVLKNCEVCLVEFEVIKCRETTAKYCSRACSDKTKPAKPNTVCTTCGKEFHMKESQKKRYSRTLGVFCSVVCSAKNKSESYLGEKNPNNKGRNTDHDGYRIYSPHASGIVSGKKVKLHIATAMEVLGVEKIPKGFHVHHRDCDILNNHPDNLAVLSVSDHVWLHKQFGNATLWAYSREKISFDQLVSWSDNEERAIRLLNTSVETQKGEF